LFESVKKALRYALPVRISRNPARRGFGQIPPDGRNFHEMAIAWEWDALLVQRASEYAGKTFITEPDTGRTMTFGELAASVRTLRAALAVHGFYGDEPVMLLSRNGIPAAVAIFSILSGGGTVLPVNPEATAAELEFLLRHSGAGFVLAASELAIMMGWPRPHKSGIHR
jgi:acyl-CoA synthetase (AMP-forming)/AMP-acid ligase II